MKPSLQFAVLLLVGVATFFLLRHGARALEPARPPDVAADAQFAQSGYDLQRNEPVGQWVSCALKPAQATNWCRVTDRYGIVVYQGDMLPLASTDPVPASQLSVAPIDPDRLWTRGPAEGGGLVPVVPLRNGSLLVPIADREALAARWQQHPEELAALTQQN